MQEIIFIDTSAWAAIADKSDRYHKIASSSFKKILNNYKKIVTSNLVISETYTLLIHELGHPAGMKFLTSLQGSSRIHLVYSNREIETDAIKFLADYSDQDFSYTDAVSFIIMKRYSIHEAFSFDKHFIIAGFTLA